MGTSPSDESRIPSRVLSMHFGTSKSALSNLEHASGVDREKRDKKPAAPRDHSLKHTHASDLRSQNLHSLKQRLVCAGDIINIDGGSGKNTLSSFLRGRGVVECEQTGRLKASISGLVEQVYKLIYIKPPSEPLYVGSVGDIVVGRVTDVQQDRWSVDVGAGKSAGLHINAINLPGNVQRRRTAADRLLMRTWFTEGDLICAEVQQTSNEGGDVSLQTRSAKYGKIHNGVLAQVPPGLIIKQSSHVKQILKFDEDDAAVQIILGCNGLIYFCQPPKFSGAAIQTLNYSQQEQKDETVNAKLRQKLLRAKLVTECLGRVGADVTIENIEKGYQIREEWEREKMVGRDVVGKDSGESAKERVLSSQDAESEFLEELVNRLL